MAQEKRLTIDKQLHSAWSCLYAIEVDDSVSEELMLEYLNEAAGHIAALRARKRLSLRQREKLANIEKWYGSYDLTRLQQDVRNRNRDLADTHAP